MVANKQVITTLKRRSEFLSILKLGRKKKITSWLVVAYLKNYSGKLRVGWTIPKQVGNAVVRNRIKRLIRENLKKSELPPGFLGADVNFIFRYGAKDEVKNVSYEQIQKLILNAFDSIFLKT